MLEKFSRNAAAWLINIGLLNETDIDLYSYAIKNLFLIINPTIMVVIIVSLQPVALYYLLLC